MSNKLAGEVIIPGAFYISRQPGGWADANTGIHIPGPIVKIDKITREVVGIDSMPNPVQMPTHKISFLTENKNERGEVPFDRVDAEATCEGFNLALQTGNIELISNETVKELFPKAWANRQDKIVHSKSSADTKPLGELLDDFMQQRRLRLKSGESIKAQDEAKAAQREKERVERIQSELQNSVGASLSANATAESAPAPAAPLPPAPPPIPPTAPTE